MNVPVVSMVDGRGLHVGKQLPDSSGTLSSTRSVRDPSRERKCQQPGNQLDVFVLIASARIGPWARGKPLAWDLTVPDTYTDSHINSTSITAGAAANHAATAKSAKYANLTSTHIFVPFVIETGCVECSGHRVDPRNWQTHNSCHG